MLQTLRLSQFVVVEEAEIVFGPGLTVLTGETGAGKSIVIDALALALGARADASVVRAGAEEAVVEALFEKTPGLARRLEELGLPDLGSEVLIRRVIGRGGRGRAFINGSLVAVGMLAKAMRGVVDVAGQHEHMALLDAASHRELLDRVGNLEQEREAFAATWASLQALERQLEALGGDDAQVAARVDFVAFQLDELERAGLVAGEDVALEAERARLASVGKLQGCATEAEALISSADGAALERAGKAIGLLQEGARFDPALGVVTERLRLAQGELDDCARVLSRYLSGLESNPGRLAEVDDRLDLLKRLSRKHAAPLAALLERREGLRSELAALRNRGALREALAGDRARALAEATRCAAALTQGRRRAARQMESAVGRNLERLALKGAVLSVGVGIAPLGASGADAVELLFSANPGEVPRPLAKVASGGEASRLLLALRASLAGKDGLACEVLDEADAGVGGAVADVVGRLIRDVSAHRQVLCITHLPQVAAHADLHLKVEKQQRSGRTTSKVRALDEAERSQELARMLSGVTVTREAVLAAQALLRAARKKPAPARPARGAGSSEAAPVAATA